MNIITLEKHLLNGLEPKVALVEGSWVAGGAVRRYFTGEKPEHDIDVFCKDQNVVNNFIAMNGLIRSERIRNERMIMFFNSPIQIILLPQFLSPEDTIEHFDFTLCQFAWDGTKVISTKSAEISTLRKHLGVFKIQPGFELDSLRRAFKYAKQGFTPCIGTIRDLAEVLNTAPADNLLKYNDISPERWD